MSTKSDGTTKKRKGVRVNVGTRTMTMYIPWHPTFEDNSTLLTWMYRQSTRGACYVPKNGTIARVTIHLPATGIIKKARKSAPIDRSKFDCDND